jgi:4-aminobutyrate aminotransferase-like enzyme
MPPVLTEAARPSKKRSRVAETKAPVQDGARALHVLEKHVLMDGFKIVIDLEKSRGSYMYDEATGRRLIDLYGFFGSLTIGFNHPYFDEPTVKEDLLRAAKFKVANSDIYSEGYAEFVDAFSRVAGFPPLDRYLFIEGGALAIENTLKAAMDWKVRKNMATGRGERGTEILHFRHAFHGRSGYTMSLTNTDPRKTDLFAKFNWPRVSTPSIDFSLPEAEREADVIAREKKSEAEIMAFIRERGLNETMPGEVAEMDFERLGLLRNPEIGRSQWIWGLSITLTYSRHSFLWPLVHQTVEATIEGLEKAWAFFQGCPKRLVLDNFPAAVAGTLTTFKENALAKARHASRAARTRR